MEVHQQSQPVLRALKIADQLGLMDRQNLIDCLQLNDYARFDKRVQTLPVYPPPTSVTISSVSLSARMV